ncbi:probable glutamine--tRNA ligase [Penaeus japonicus]|uniref:probable glutamine--tRNA ligase n=1 Tax=Penaeus japonicus TaxID=27405 RepID=UPI001C70F635|nr:probable glutamine--tRNA ligase [Penaeus japonicus]
MNPGRFVNGEFVLTDSRRKGMNFRFAPEPSGALHIGHVKNFRTNFNCAAENGGKMILRFDDTNPETSCSLYCRDAKKMLQWLGYDHSAVKTTFTSNYFAMLLSHARRMVWKGLAYVCHLDIAEATMESPWRDRSVEKNIREFEKMVSGVYNEGDAVLRLKYRDKYIKDPVAYRVKVSKHFRTGNKWKVYPTYDFSNSIVDYIENIAVSICTTEFAHRRPLYNWIQEKLDIPPVPQQEQPRLVLKNVILSKRKLNRLLGKHGLHGMDDPRLATLAGLRSRGIPPKAIEKFLAQGFRDFAQLLNITRKELARVPTEFCKMVLNPIYCLVENYSEVASSDEDSQEPPIMPFFYISGCDFDDDDILGDVSPHTLSPKRPAKLFQLPYMAAVKKVERQEGIIRALTVTLTPSKKDSGLKPLIWVHKHTRATLAYADHRFKGDDPVPAPIRYADVYLDKGIISSTKLGRNFVYGQTFLALNIGYVTVSRMSVKKDILYIVTCFLGHKRDHLNNILKCFW